LVTDTFHCATERYARELTWLWLLVQHSEGMLELVVGLSDDDLLWWGLQTTETFDD
jgi:hypothetical protein